MFHATLIAEDTTVVATYRKKKNLPEDAEFQGEWHLLCCDSFNGTEKETVLTMEQWQSTLFLMYGNDEGNAEYKYHYSVLNSGTDAYVFKDFGQCSPVP